MVTLPTEAATDREFVTELIRRGMDCARINCAHDTAPEWTKMAENVRQAAKQLGEPCRVLMDLGGPEGAHRADRAGSRRSSSGGPFATAWAAWSRRPSCCSGRAAACR